MELENHDGGPVAGALNCPDVSSHFPDGFQLDMGQAPPLSGADLRCPIGPDLGPHVGVPRLGREVRERNRTLGSPVILPPL